MVEYIKENPDNFTSQDPKTNIIDLNEKIIRVQGFFSQLEEAIEKKEMDTSIRYIRLDGIMMEKNTVVFNTTRVYGIDGTKTEEINRATLILRKQIMQLVDFAKKYMPGFEDSYLDISASYFGIRETRHISGEYILTYEDIIQNRKFDDVVLISHIFGYPEKKAVVHYPDQILEGSRDDIYSRNQVRQYLGPVDLPYRSLIPKQIDNLLLAGRNLSADHYATNKGAGGRNIPKAMNTGQVSGTAAALSVREGVKPRLLDVKKLQRTLIEQGIDLESARVLKK